ncbi:MAG: hypothetical protein EA359_01365 [Balneolaceae bacterium]|nr:MAG: hypothetical protein EA359_01365 [Balneolaceae bacterium]
MWILSLFLLFAAIFGAFAGFQNWFRFDQLTKTNVLNTSLFVLIIFTVLMIMYVLGYFPQAIAAPFMMTIYSVLAGFFTGYANSLLAYRRKAGSVLYQHRSFWIDHAPSLLAIVLILYGLYRTSILTEPPVTGIRVTSGISLMSFGYFAWTLKVVPEFRSKGILFLDRFIHWKEVIAWSWQSETSIGIEFLDRDKKNGERIKEFYTSIPEEEKKEIELVLKSKMEEYSEERKKILFKEDES